MKMATISLRDVENQERGGVFILNKSSGIERGRIVFPVPKANGIGSDAVVIPPTFIPLDLTEQVSRKQLLESSEFRRAVNSRRIELIDAAEYERLMREQGAQEERDRLYNKEQIYMNTVQSLDNIMDKDNNLVDPALQQQQSSQRDQVEEHQALSEEGVAITPPVLQVVAALEEEKDETAAISTLRGLGELTEADYNYVMKNAPKEFQQIRTFCTRNLQRLRNKA